MNKENKQEPSFPEPFEPFNQEMTADIQQLRWAEQQLESFNQQWEQANKNIKDKSPDHADYKNLANTERYYNQEIQKLQKEIPVLKSKIYGRFERLFEEHEVEPELANQVMQVLDEKVYPEKYENKSLEEDKQLNHEAKLVESKDAKSEIGNDSHSEHTENVNNLPPQGNNYTISLIQRKKEEQAKLKASINEKTVDIDKNVTQNSAHLNYQLKYQKPVSKEQPKEKLVKDFSKNNKDISLDKD